MIYIVLPNGMHEEYVTRGAKTGKHILCEKPMANSSAEAQRMIDACSKADVKLMIAYRQHYEPHNSSSSEVDRRGPTGQTSRLSVYQLPAGRRSNAVAAQAHSVGRRVPPGRRHLLRQCVALLVRRRAYPRDSPIVEAEARSTIYRSRSDRQLHHEISIGLSCDMYDELRRTQKPKSSDPGINGVGRDVARVCLSRQ